MRALNRLSPPAIKIAKPGKYCDGGGLWLIKRPDGGAQWVFRYTINGRRTEMGVGALRDVSLAQARRQAERWRSILREGFDPRRERDRQRLDDSRERPTLNEMMEGAFEARKAQLKNDGKAGRWDSPLRVHIAPRIGETPIEDLSQIDIKATLDPIWHTKPEAARKALNRLRIVFRHAAALGIDVDLQAMDKAKALLGAQRHETTHIPALPWPDVPAFYATLDGGSPTELALRLLILTAARSGEIRGCRLSEIEDHVWTLPPERTKTGKEHRIPLSGAAEAVVSKAAQFARNGYLFPGRGRGVISDMTMTALFRRRGLDARPHGFRSSFRTWCAEATDTPREIAETCLGHSTAGKVEAAYRRTDYLEQRRALMERWAEFVETKDGETTSPRSRGN